PAEKPEARRRTTAASTPRGDADKKVSPVLSLASTTGLGDTKALVQQLRTLVVTNRACLARSGGGELALKLTIDRAGKIVKVELVRGPAAALGCLRSAVAGLVTATKATGLSGVAEVVIAL
ncbi:MAG TPA: hypothetical protein VN914_08575, partial [Polyangia bacterium]|nr:hypothetical protein [Polyangia bacterium]